MEGHSHNGYFADEHLCLKSHPLPSMTTESGAQGHLPSLTPPRELSLEIQLPGSSPERLGVVADRKWSSLARRVGTGKVWPEPREPAAGRKESPGGPHPQQAMPGRQKARALGRTSPASGDPGMSFRT